MISELTAADYNPRKISEDQIARLKKGIEKFGITELPVWNERSRTLISGHQRIAVMYQLGLQDQEIKVIVMDLDPNEERALNLLMNKGGGDWDLKALAEMLDSLPFEARGDTGFTDEEIADLIASLAVEPEEEDLEGSGDMNETNLSMGDIYALGRHRIMCGDPMNADDLEKLVFTGEADVNFLSVSPDEDVIGEKQDVSVDHYVKFLLASDKVKRRVYLMETDPYWVDQIIQAWEKKTKGVAIHMGENKQ